jgi:hypothetical protein
MNSTNHSNKHAGAPHGDLVPPDGNLPPDGDLPSTGDALVAFKRSNLAPAEGFGRANFALDDPMTRLAELDGFSAISADDNDLDGHEAIAIRGAADASLEYQ